MNNTSMYYIALVFRELEFNELDFLGRKLQDWFSFKCRVFGSSKDQRSEDGLGSRA